MAIRGTIGVIVLVLVLLACTGCTQPATTGGQVPANTGVNRTSVPVPFPNVTVEESVISGPVTIPAATSMTGQVTPTALPAGNPEPGGFARFTGTDYSIDYPAGWSSNVTILPLREYRHSQYGCSVTFAYNLDQELRLYYSRDGSTLFYSTVVNTGRDIWPRNWNGEVVYEDIVNSVLGNPEYCANTPDNAFRIAGISRVPLNGVSYTGVGADFSKINGTGFTEGSGTAWVVTGTNHRGVFTFYSTAREAGTQDNLAKYMFDSLRLEPGF